MYNEFIKRAVKKNLGDSVHVTLEIDIKKHEVIIPDYIGNELKKSNVLESFSKQPDYLKHEQINQIEKAKKRRDKEK